MAVAVAVAMVGCSKVPVFCMLLTLLFAAAESVAPAPAVDCSSLVMDMADCLSYVTAGGTATKPEATCCSGLKTVLKTDAECLCEAFRNSAQLGITLDMNKALALPSACHVSAPSVSNCGLKVGTGAAPALSPLAAASPSSIAGAPTAITGNSEIAPAPAPGSPGSSPATANSIPLLVLTMVVAGYFAFC